MLYLHNAQAEVGRWRERAGAVGAATPPSPSCGMRTPLPRPWRQAVAGIQHFPPFLHDAGGCASLQRAQAGSSEGDDTLYRVTWCIPRACIPH